MRTIDAGFADDDDRAGWLEAADVVCLPSEAEIFPLTLLKAWSVGTPVVTSDLPPLVELLKKAGGGLTSPRTRGTWSSARQHPLKPRGRAQDGNSRSRVLAKRFHSGRDCRPL